MKTIILFFLLAITINAQNWKIIIMSSDPTVASIDTIPSQFNFVDVTDAVLSSYNQAYIVVAGCDSARFYPASGDSLKLGVLGTYDVDPIWADVGDSIYVPNVASASNSTATHSIIYSSNGTPLDTFTITTTAGGGSSYLTDSLRLYYDDSDLSNGSISTWIAHTGYTGDLGLWLSDTTDRAIMTSGGLVFDGTDWYYLTAPSGIGDSQLSLEFVVEIQDTAANQVIGGFTNTGVKGLTLKLEDDRLTANANNGTGYSMDVYSTPVFQTMSHIVVTWSGGAVKPKIYINGVLAPEKGSSYLGAQLNHDIVALGGDDANYVVNGTIFRLFRLYELELTAQQVQDNYNSTSVQSKLP